jgi:hypothetical protein
MSKKPGKKPGNGPPQAGAGSGVKFDTGGS